MLLAVEIAYDPPAWLQLAIWLPITLFASLGLLQPVKGTIVALQWQTGMHGFEQTRARGSQGRVAISGKASHAFQLTGRGT